MDLHIISSNAYLRRLLEENPAALRSQAIATRDWFVEKGIRAAGYEAIIVDNNLTVAEAGELAKKATQESCNWYKGKGNSDFSVYRGISLADSAQQHFYHDIFTHLFSLIPNVSKLVEKYSPKKIVYEHHESFRKSLNFNNEDILLGHIAEKYGIEFECVRTYETDAADALRNAHSTVLKRERDYIVRTIRTDRIRGLVFDAATTMQLIKHRARALLFGKKPCILTDCSRGTQDFWEAFSGDRDCTFIINRPLKGVLANLIEITVALKSHRGAFRYKKELDRIRKEWRQFLVNHKERFNYFGMDFSGYIDNEVSWAIENIFPALMEVTDKASAVFKKAGVDCLLSQTDSPITYRYIYNIAKKNGIRNFTQPDGIRSTIEPGYRHADNVLVYSEAMRSDLASEGVSSSFHVVGNPRFQAVYRQRESKGAEPALPLRVLIGMKAEGPQVIGHHYSSSNALLEEILRALRPFKDRIRITVRTNPGQSECLEQIKRLYLPQDDFEIQRGETIPFEVAAQGQDLFIMSWTTAIVEAAVLGKMVIYYANDAVFQYPPFDGASELAALRTNGELEEAIKEILNGGRERYLRFGKKDVMEKYAGPLEKPSAVEMMREAVLAPASGGRAQELRRA